ncbi:hypothetical protein [Diaphorobacter caeni]|uniref:hypothetical protein n=1 Tax=Diaphorobacter caeni TaxID=2784387 RepID=UPI00188DF13C|nr:hypothetical protein [Diaphorobacter caeni]MBF5006792.1 hypothetical protein [Diaphorobacter caeni]
MHFNLIIYQYRNDDVLRIYQSLHAMGEGFGVVLNKMDYLFKLPLDKSNHPGDFKSKSISNKKLVEGISLGEIDSFSLANTTDLRDSDGVFFYVNSTGYGGTSNITVHVPISHEELLKQLSVELIKNVEPGYGFCLKTDSALKGVAYTLASTIYKNERNNFSSYLQKGCLISQPRMIYLQNYFTNNQLNFVSGGVSLRDFVVENFGGGALKPLSDSIFNFDVSDERLVEVNNVFGEAGFLISWVEGRKR